MSESIKFAGRNDAGNVTPVSVSDDGSIRQKRQFGCSWNEQKCVWYPDDTDPDVAGKNNVFKGGNRYYYKSVNVSHYGMVAIAIKNRSNHILTLDLCESHTPLDAGLVTASSDAHIPAVITDSDGGEVAISIPIHAFVVITPEDWPVLNYLNNVTIALTVPNNDSRNDATTSTRLWIIDKE